MSQNAGKVSERVIQISNFFWESMHMPLNFLRWVGSSPARFGNVSANLMIEYH